MKKLYKLSADGVPTDYHEAWLDNADREIVEHFGKLGTEGETRQHQINPLLDKMQNLDQILQKAVLAGYAEIGIDKHAWLIVEYIVDGFGTPEDLDKRHQLEDMMNEILGWTGLGHCDGGSIGSGTMEVACPVVHFDLAKHIVAEKLANGPFSNYSRIYDEAVEDPQLNWSS